MRRTAVLTLFAITCVLVLAWGEQRKPVVPPLEKPRMPNEAQASPERHKTVTRRVFDDLFNRGRYEAISEIYNRDCIVHQHGKTMRLDDAVSEGKGWRSAAPDLQMTPEQMSVQGDIVTVSWVARGSHSGKGNGLMRPTGKHFQVRGVSRFRVSNGKIAEVWNDWDRNELFRQIGVSPTAAYLYDKAEDIKLAFSHIFSSDPS
jgi:steroid delta-isomerase-like uncharacterized protein